MWINCDSKKKERECEDERAWKWLLRQSHVFFYKCLWFLHFFISTSVQRQGVTDDFLELVPPHPFTRAFFSILCLSFFFTLSLFLFFSFSFAFSLHQHTTNDIIIWAFHSLFVLCINYISLWSLSLSLSHSQYCACTSNTIYLFIYLS